MENRIIKFEVLRDDTKELVGHERIGDSGHWEHLRPKRDVWLLGAITDGQEYAKFIRRQFTGRYDADKKEIYEGDIIEFDRKEWGGDDNIHLVSWDNDNSEWSFGGGCASDMHFRKVIGNIHQNKNLLQ